VFHVKVITRRISKGIVKALFGECSKITDVYTCAALRNILKLALRQRSQKLRFRKQDDQQTKTTNNIDDNSRSYNVSAAPLFRRYPLIEMEGIKMSETECEKDGLTQLQLELHQEARTGEVRNASTSDSAAGQDKANRKFEIDASSNVVAVDSEAEIGHFNDELPPKPLEIRAINLESKSLPIKSAMLYFD